MTIHAGLAGILCTTALILAAVELGAGRFSSRAHFMFGLYGVGTLIWTALALATDSYALILISTAQSAAAFYCALQSKLKS